MVRGKHPPMGLGRRRKILASYADDRAAGTIWALFVDTALSVAAFGRDLSRRLRDQRRRGHRTACSRTDPGTRGRRFYRAADWKARRHQQPEANDLRRLMRLHAARDFGKLDQSG